MMRFALITDTKQMGAGDLMAMSRALEINAMHCWRAWQQYLPPWASDAPPSIMLWDNEPLTGWRDSHLAPVYFLSDDSRSPDVLAVHFVEGIRPAGRVFVDRGSGLNEGLISVTELASHEILEMIVNPWLDHWEHVPGRLGYTVPREVCDPTQRHYEVTATGRPWRVSNFVLPSWFGLRPVTAQPGEPVDHIGELEGPGTIGPEGYIVKRDGWEISYEFGQQYAGAREFGSVGKPMGRTREIVARARG